MSDEKQTIAMDKLGGRKAMGFYAALVCSFILALLDKANAEILGLIDTLYLVFAGANVAAKRVAMTQKKEEVEP